MGCQSPAGEPFFFGYRGGAEPFVRLLRAKVNESGLALTRELFASVNRENSAWIVLVLLLADVAAVGRIYQT